MSFFKEDLGLISPTDLMFMQMVEKGETGLVMELEEEEESLDMLLAEVDSGDPNDSGNLPS